jgi:hypothetical protein
MMDSLDSGDFTEYGMKFRSVAASEMSALRNVMLTRNRLERKRNLQKKHDKRKVPLQMRAALSEMASARSG